MLSMSKSDASPKGVDSRPPQRFWPFRFAALSAAALAAFVVLLFLWGREPHYHGKALSGWLSDFNRIPPDRPAPEAEEAIRAIGERSLPFLLSNIWSTEPNLVWRSRVWI